MSRWHYWVVAAFATALFVLACTPLGPLSLARLLERDAGEWQVAVGGQGGTLLFGFSLAEIHCYNPVLGLEAEIAAVEFSLWAWSASARTLSLRVESGAQEADEPPADIELPLAIIPDIAVTEGRLDFISGDFALTARDWHASYGATGDSAGVLELAMPEVRVGERTLAVTGELQLSPRQIDNGWIDVRVVDDNLRIAAQISFGLDLALPQPLEAITTLQIETDSLRAELTMVLDGALVPLRLAGELTGVGTIPATGEMTLRGRVQSDEDVVSLDSLAVSVLDGELTGRGRYAADSLSLLLAGSSLDMAPLATEGDLDFELAAVVDVRQLRYEADLRAHLRDVELAPEQHSDVELVALHQYSGQTQVELQSAAFALTAQGTSDLNGVYDLTLSGRIAPDLWVERAVPVAVVGRAFPDSLALSLRSDALPGTVGTALGSVAADLILNDHRHLAVDLRLERGMGGARARVDLARERVDTLEAWLHKLPLQHIDSTLDGAVDAFVHGSGGLSLRELALDGNIAVENVVHAEWHSPDIGAIMKLRQGVVEAVVESRDVRATVKWDTTQMLTADVAIERLVGSNAVAARFGRSVVAERAEGDSLLVQGEIYWRGPLDDLRMASVRVALDSLSWSAESWRVYNEEPLDLVLDSGELDFARLQLSTPVGLLTLTGRAGLDSLALALAAPALRLDGMVPDFYAHGTGYLYLGGTWQRPEAQGLVELSSMRLDTLALGGAQIDLSLADTLVVRAAAQAGLRATLSSPAALLLGRGRGHAKLMVAAEQADLGPVLSYALRQPSKARLDMDGTLYAALGDTAWDWAALSGRLMMRDLWAATLVDGDSLQLNLSSPGALTIHRGQAGLDSLALRFRRYDRDRLALRPAGAMRLAGEISAVSTSQLDLALDSLDLVFLGGPEGRADVRARLSGMTTAPQLAAELRVETEDFGEVSGRFAGDENGGRWNLNWTTLIEDSLVVTGQVPWDLAAGEVAWDQGRLAVQSEGIRLFVFADLIADLDHLDGRIGADLQIVGLDPTLALHGELEVADFELALLDLEPIYALPDGRLRFDGRRVALEGFVANGEPKRGFHNFELGGQLDLVPLDDPDFDLRLQIERLASRYEDIFQADDINLDLAFTGALSDSRLAGRIRLDRPRSEPTLVAFNAPPVPPPPPALRNDFLENMALDIELELRSLSLASELAEVGASGAVDIGGNFYKPIFQGDIAIEEGRIFLLNQSFAFDVGRIVFNSLELTGSILDVVYDPLELNPELDIIASTPEPVEDINDEGSTYEVSLRLQGRAQEVVPQFSSEPSRDFASIVNLLAFNTMSFSEAKYSAAFGAVAGQLLGKRVDKIGLDDFALLPSSTVVGAESGAAIRVGKYLDSLPAPLWVRYEALLDEISSGEVRIEHRVGSFLTITGSAQSEYDRYGVGIGLRKKF